MHGIAQRLSTTLYRPEMLIRRELHRRGLRYRVNYAPLPGRPDLAFTSARVAVFVDGCFWHVCPDHAVLPRNNREWWQDKRARNVARDREKDAQLDAMGWVAVHVWEHENPVRAADAIEVLWRSRRRPPARRAGRTSRPRVV
jgi:DNA mismatch endonuclease, patch repair protein